MAGKFTLHRIIAEHGEDRRKDQNFFVEGAVPSFEAVFLRVSSSKTRVSKHEGARKK